MPSARRPKEGAMEVLEELTPREEENNLTTGRKVRRHKQRPQKERTVIHS
jgi:hypothetical protein